jgi:hypothetical protein
LPQFLHGGFLSRLCSQVFIVKQLKRSRALAVHALDARRGFSFPIYDLSDFVGALTDSIKEPKHANGSNNNRQTNSQPPCFAVTVLSHASATGETRRLMQERKWRGVSRGFPSRLTEARADSRRVWVD